MQDFFRENFCLFIETRAIGRDAVSLLLHLHGAAVGTLAIVAVAANIIVIIIVVVVVALIVIVVVVAIVVVAVLIAIIGVTAVVGWFATVVWITKHQTAAAAATVIAAV